MSTFWRRFLLVLGLIALGGGCNPLMLPFLFTLKEPTKPAEFHKISSEDKKKEVKVVVLSYMGLEVRPEFLNADREIMRSLAVHLKQLTEGNKENVTLVNPSKVEEYMRENPDWNSTHLDLNAIGKHFKADYVIYLEIGSLSLYQPDTFGTFYRGLANVTVSLVDINKPDDFTLGSRDITFCYPPEAQGGSQAVDADTPPQMFKMKFLDALGQRLSWMFSDRPTRDSYLGGSSLK
jgi:hypothetical protein